MLLAIIIWILVFWLVCEFVTIAARGLHHYIKGYGRILLEKELSDCRINPHYKNIITLKQLSELNGDYLAVTGSSILFPYYVSANWYSVNYGILIFTKEYYIVRNKFKELRKLSNKKRRLKF